MQNSKFRVLTSFFVGALLVMTSPILVYADPYGVDTDPSYVTTEQQNDWYSDVSLSSGHTVDKVRTSDTYYRTVAVTVTRCIPGTMTPVGESYIAEVYNTSCTQANGKQYNVFGTSYEDFVGKASAEWQAEYNAAKYGDFDGDYYIKIDCVMAVCENGKWITDPNGSLRMYDTYDSIANAEAWANKNGLKTHFNKYIKITKNKDALQKLKNKILPAAEDSGDGNGGGGLDEYDYQLTHDETAPIEYHEGNSSPDGFDIGTGIPTTENCVELTLYDISIRYG